MFQRQTDGAPGEGLRWPPLYIFAYQRRKLKGLCMSTIFQTKKHTHVMKQHIQCR